MCFSRFLAPRRREQVLLEERGAEGNGGGLVGMRCWGMSWMMKWHTEGINEHAWRLPAPWGRRGKYCSADNELPESEKIASAAAVRNVSCPSLQREPDTFESVYVYLGSGRYKLGLGQKKPTKHIFYERCDLYRKMKVVWDAAWYKCLATPPAMFCYG